MDLFPHGREENSLFPEMAANRSLLCKYARQFSRKSPSATAGNAPLSEKCDAFVSLDGLVQAEEAFLSRPVQGIPRVCRRSASFQDDPVLAGSKVVPLGILPRGSFVPQTEKHTRAIATGENMRGVERVRDKKKKENVNCPPGIRCCEDRERESVSCGSRLVRAITFQLLVNCSLAWFIISLDSLAFRVSQIKNKLRRQQPLSLRETREMREACPRKWEWREHK